MTITHYPCPECHGDRVTECWECGAEHDCELCDATGYDPEQVDIVRWSAAVREFCAIDGFAFGLQEDGAIVGYTNRSGAKLYVRDFLK